MTKDQLRDHTDGHTKFNSRWMFDARGIELCRVCDTCENARRATYAPEVLGESGNYTDVVDEQIEADY